MSVSGVAVIIVTMPVVAVIIVSVVIMPVTTIQWCDVREVSPSPAQS